MWPQWHPPSIFIFWPLLYDAPDLVQCTSYLKLTLADIWGCHWAAESATARDNELMARLEYLSKSDLRPQDQDMLARDIND